MAAKRDIRETGQLTRSYNDGSTLLMWIALKIECRTSHGPPHTLHLAHKSTRLDMGTRLCWVHKHKSSQNELTHTHTPIGLCDFILLPHTRACERLLSLHPQLVVNAPLWVHVYFIRIAREQAKLLHERKMRDRINLFGKLQWLLWH